MKVLFLEYVYHGIKNYLGSDWTSHFVLLAIKLHSFRYFLHLGVDSFSSVTKSRNYSDKKHCHRVVGITIIITQ